jgi:hypothetical protein
MRKLKRAEGIREEESRIRVKRPGEQICEEALVRGTPVFADYTHRCQVGRLRVPRKRQASSQLGPVFHPAGKVGSGADLPIYSIAQNDRLGSNIPVPG